MNRFRLILYFFFLSVVSLSGHDFSYSYIPLSVEDGLSQPNVTALLTDARGSLWIGTKNGLNRFDQREISVFTVGGVHSSGLAGNVIRGLSETSDGVVWIQTTRGLSRYLPETDTFEKLSDAPCFCSLTIDDAVLVGGNGVLYRIQNGSSQVECLFPFGKGSEAENNLFRIVRMLDLGNGEILLGTERKGLYRYIPGEAPRPFSQVVYHQLIALSQVSTGQVYAAFFGDGVHRYGPDGLEQAHFLTTNSALTNNYVQDFAEFDGNLWMSTDGGGISLLSLSNGEFTSLTHVPGRPDSLPSNSVTSLYLDSSGTLWAGTVKHGFFQVRRNYVRSFHGHGYGLNDNAVISLYRDDGGILWVGTDGGGLHRFDATSNCFIPMPGTHGKVLSIAGYDSRHLLVSLYMEGFFLVDRVSGQQKPFMVRDEETNRQACFSGYLPRACQVSSDKLYILSHIPLVFDLRTHTFSQMKTEVDTRADNFQMACSDSRHSFFYRDNAVFMVYQADDIIRPLFQVSEEETVTALAFDGVRELWVGTDRGLGRYDLATGSYFPVPTSLFDSVSALEFDSDGRLWICARNHFLTYLCEENRFISWTRSDGFLPNNIKMLYQNETDPEFLYMGGSGGLVQVDRNLPVPILETLPIFLDQLDVNGTSALSLLEGKTIRIPWNYQSLSASFLVKSSDAFQRILFRYTVEDSQARTFDSYDSKLTLPTLSPGTYHVFVSCMTKRGDFTSPVEMLEVVILPPWYRSLWFYFLIALFVMAAAVWANRRVLKNQEHENKNSMAHFLEGMLQEEPNRPEEANASSDPEFRRKLDKVIRENLSNPDLDVKFLTEKLLMSRTTLYDKVKQETGMGVKDYINRLRIERSVDLLLHTDMNINEISYEVGFSYPRYFSTSFKNMKGVTPTRFKQQNRSGGLDNESK